MKMVVFQILIAIMLFILIAFSANVMLGAFGLLNPFRLSCAYGLGIVGSVFFLRHSKSH